MAVSQTGNAYFVQENGGMFYITTNSERKNMPGRGKDISVGADGTVYCIGGRAVPGGHGIWKWAGKQWEKVKGRGARRIAVGPNGNPWIVTDKNEIFKQNVSGGWKRVEGQASAIAVGPEGSVMVLGVKESKGGFSVKKLGSDGQWHVITNGATEMSIGKNGRPYFVTK